MTDHSEFTVKFARLILKVREIRGKVLDEAIFIEFILDLIIIKYFCESTSKIGLFQATLLNQAYFPFPLSAKINTFKTLNLGDKCKSVIKELSSDLGKAKDMRNQLAHRMIDNSDEAIDEELLRLVYYEGGIRKYQSISEEELKQKLKLLEKVKITLLHLLMEGDFSRESKINIDVG